MFGSDRTNGLLKRSVEYILQIEHMIVSCVELAGNDFHDLVDNRKRIAKIDDGTKKRISSTAEFDILISKVLKLRVQKATDQNATSSRSHLFINFEDDSGTKLSFIDLAGWENAKNKPETAETIFLNRSLSSLNTALEKVETDYIPSYDSLLAKAFKKHLQTSKVYMLYHVSNAGVVDGLKNIKKIVASNKTPPQTSHSKPFKDITNQQKNKQI